MNEQNYEKPEVLPGDLIECLATGGKGIIGNTSDRHESHPVQWSIVPLLGAGIRVAWWGRSEFKVLEKGPAHKYWAGALLVQKARDEDRARRSDIDWVISNWETVEPSPMLASVTAILREAGLLPNQVGRLSRGEIGFAAMELFQIFQALQGDIAEAMSEPDPKAALRELGAQVRARSEQ